MSTVSSAVAVVVAAAAAAATAYERNAEDDASKRPKQQQNRLGGVGGVDFAHEQKLEAGLMPETELGRRCPIPFMLAAGNIRTVPRRARIGK